MASDGELVVFTASYGGQVGKAKITTMGVAFVAAGSVHSTMELRGSDVLKFKVTPEKNPKAILRFERAPPNPPIMIQVSFDAASTINNADSSAAL